MHAAETGPDRPDAPLPGRPISVWRDTTPTTSYPPLGGDREFDVAVVGGGIVGVTTAALLKEAGVRVALVEARRIVEGVTGNTTAKLTVLHGLHFRDLVRRVGEDRARLHARANLEAVARLSERVRARGIDCDLAAADAFTYAERAEDVPRVEEEADVLGRLGVDSALTTEVGLPFPVRAAVRVQSARFHPRKYLLALAAGIPGGGSEVFEETPAIDVDEGSPCVVRTERGSIRAKDVVVATHQPFLLRGVFFAKLRLRRSYVLGVYVRGPVPQGLYISAESDFRSMRPQPVEGRDLLLVGGEPHRPGHAADTSALVRRLEAWARARFDVESVAYRWATHDAVSSDGLPYVGRLSGDAKHVWVATGFGGWGMSNGESAAAVLADLVLGRESPYREVYDPARGGLPRAAVALARDAVVEMENLLAAGREVPGDGGDVAPGEAKVVDWGYDKYAVYRDETGRLHRVSAACTHLGCLVAWNSAERTWDCPCHGSRFAPDGTVIHGPATRPLPRDTPE